MKTHALILLTTVVLAMICSMVVAAMREGVRIEANGKVIDIDRGHLVPCVSDWNNDERKDLLVGNRWYDAKPSSGGNIWLFLAE